MGSFGSGELIILLVIVLLVFGGSQLPKLAKNLGKAQKEFKDGLDAGLENNNEADTRTTDTRSTDVRGTDTHSTDTPS